MFSYFSLLFASYHLLYLSVLSCSYLSGSLVVGWKCHIFLFKHRHVNMSSYLKLWCSEAHGLFVHAVSFHWWQRCGYIQGNSIYDFWWTMYIIHFQSNCKMKMWPFHCCFDYTDCVGTTKYFEFWASWIHITILLHLLYVGIKCYKCN